MLKLRSRGFLAYIIIFFFLYIYIYNPIFVFVKIGLVKVLLLLSLIFLFKNWGKLREYFRDYGDITKLLLFAIIYCLIVKLLNSGNANTPYTMFVWLLETTLIPIYLINRLFVKYNLSLLGSLLPISIIAACISLFLLINPSINDFVLGGIIEKPYENNLGVWSRCFGIAEGLTNSYGIIQGVFASVCLLKGRESAKYYLFAILISLSVIINARTGIIPIAMTLLYVVLNSIKGGQIKFFVLIAFSTILILNIVVKYEEEISSTISYVTVFFTSTYDYLIKGETGDDYYSYLEGFIHFPQSIAGVLFGEGRTMFGDKNMGSDIGYVNQIYTGGLVYLMTLITVQIRIYGKIYRRCKEHFFVVLLFITAFVINFKGITFCISEGFSRFVMLLYFVLLYNKIHPNNQIKLGL